MNLQKHIYLMVAFLCFVSISFAQNTERIFKKFTKNDHYYLVEVNDGTYYIRFFTPEIVETNFVPTGEELQEKSEAVVLTPEPIPVDIVQAENTNFLLSEGIEIKIIQKPFQIKYFYNKQEIISEKQGYFKSEHQPMEMVKGNIPNKETEKISFNLTGDEILYGGGARALPMNRRGHRLPLYNRAHYGYETHSELMNYTIPMVLSSKKYAIHFDNSATGYLDLDSKKNNTLTYETISGSKTYQIIVGKSWKKLIDHYTDLTGKQPMLPRWALGNFSSRFGYHSQQETEKTIAKFQHEKIPVDAVILDLYWFGKDIKGTMGNLEVYKDSFPNMPKMIANFKEKGIKTILITEPFVLKTSKKWNEADTKNILAKDSVNNSARYDFYFGNTGIIDLYKSEGRQWFWNIYKDLIDMGVAGMWGDLGEPEVLPSWVNFSGRKADEIHNIYGHDWARLVYEGYKSEYPNQRPFILMRAGYSGTQHYGIVPWSGDVNRTWGGLQAQPKIALQMGMQGLAFMHSDLGGFAGNLIDDELYVRWLQYGVFQPIFRPHAQEEVPSEPVFRSEKAKKLAKKAIELRYKLLPYNYNLIFENHKKGLPLMRPVFFEKNEDKNTYSDAYLWGKDILVAPVLEKNQQQQSVYFPKKSNWFDFYSDKKYEGGTTQKISLEEDKIPTFVRGGAFITMAKPMQNTEEYDSNNWTVHFYFDASEEKSKSNVYNDDGKTPKAYEKKQFEIITLKAKQKEKLLQIKLKAKIGKNYIPQHKTFTFVIHGLKRTPKKVKWGKSKTKFTWNRTLKQLQFTIKWNTKTEKNVTIKW